MLPQNLGTRTIQIKANFFHHLPPCLRQSGTCHCDRHCCAGTCCSSNSQTHACTRYELMRSKFDLDTTTMLSLSGAVPWRSPMERRRRDLLSVSRTSVSESKRSYRMVLFSVLDRGMCHTQLACLSLARLLARLETSQEWLVRSTH